MWSKKKSTYSYELRDYGLNQPEVYPAFGVASNASYNSIKYGFEVTSDMAASAQDFWKDADKAIERLVGFCDQVLAGTWPEAHESAAPQTNWTEGMVKRITWKTYADIESSDRPMLLELHGKYRSEHERKQKEVENLAKALEPHAGLLTVASYDTSDNYLPQGEFKRDKYSSDTEWYWVPAKPAGSDARPAMKKLTKPKKDAPIKNVIEFAVKSLGASALNTEELMGRFDELMKENPPPAPAPPMDDLAGEMPDMSSIPGMGDLDKLSAGLGGGVGGEEL